MSQVNHEQRAQEPLVQTTKLCQSHSLKLRSYLAAGHQTQLFELNVKVHYFS